MLFLVVIRPLIAFRDEEILYPLFIDNLIPLARENNDLKTNMIQ